MTPQTTPGTTTRPTQVYYPTEKYGIDHVRIVSLTAVSPGQWMSVNFLGSETWQPYPMMALALCEVCYNGTWVQSIQPVVSMPEGRLALPGLEEWADTWMIDHDEAEKEQT